MKLYCVIDDIRYEIVEGATFSEEYNETLDSGSIILDQVPRIEGLEPFDDVYIYDVETKGEKFYKHLLVDRFNEEMNNVRFKLYKYKISLMSETKKLEKVILPNISITQPVDKDRRRTVWEYLKVYLDLYSPKIKILKDVNSWEYQKKYSFSDFHELSDEYEEVAYLESTGTQWIRTNIQIKQNDQIIIEFKDFVLNNKYGFGQNSGTYFQMRATTSGVSIETENIQVSKHKTGDMYDFVFTSVPEVFNGHFGLFCTTNNDGPLGDGTGSGKIYYLKYYHNGLLTAHLIPCKRKSDGVLGFYDLEGEHTFYTNMGTGTFEYEAKRKPEHFNYNSVHDLFSTVDAPEMSLTNPTLRDVISQLMLTKDCIPVVHDDVIDYIDISLRHKTFKFDPNYVNYIHSGMNSEEYSTEARREYSGALSQENTCKMVEYLGFRKSNAALLTRTDLVLETRNPIYKINKIYMCYYKKAKVSDSTGTLYYTHFLCKQDITPLVTQNVTRQALSLDVEEFDDLQGKDIKEIDVTELAKFKICTVGYDIGSNQITGWGEEYTFFNDIAMWFKTDNTILENIITFMDKKTPFGYKNAGVAVTGDQYIVTVDDYGLDSIDTGEVYSRLDNNKAANQKAVFFQVEYDAMFGGALVHSKDFKDQDDLMTADNCSSSLTILEVDGLFEKEKMNRLGNRQYNIQARYTGPNAYEIMNNPEDDPDIPGCNHILGSVLENENEALYANVDDIIIYHKEYQIYENMILANYAGTYDYVLKNYFTSVYAKLRTYNLASYGESVVRAENYKEYVILNENYAIYEENTLMYDNLAKYISCFNLTLYDEYTYINILQQQINFGYIQSKFIGSEENIDNSKAFCDINTFCSGYSFCINLKMYDNVSQGIYIKYPHKTEDKVSGSVQEWAIAVDDVTDAFQEKMAFGFGHLYQDGEEIPNNDLDPDGNLKQPFIPEYSFDFQNTYGDISTQIRDTYKNKLLWLPSFNLKDPQKYIQKNVAYTINIGSNKGLVFYKDNKEVLDFTFQFEPITNSKNVFFSSYFTKLNDMSGIYNKWHVSSFANRYFGVESEIQFNIGIKWEIKKDPNNGNAQRLHLSLTIPKNGFIHQYSPFLVIPDRETTQSPKIPYDATFMTVIFASFWEGDYINYWLSNISIDENNNAKVRLIGEDSHYSETFSLVSLGWSESWSKPDIKERDFNLELVNEDSNNYYYELWLHYVDTNTQIKVLQDERANKEITALVVSSQNPSLKEDYLQQRKIMTKNLFAIVSEEKIKKEIIYDTYLSNYDWYEQIIIGQQYPLKTMIYGTQYEDVEFHVNFVDENGGWEDNTDPHNPVLKPYLGIVLDLNGVHFVKDWGTSYLDRDVVTAYRENQFEQSSFSKLTFSDGKDLNSQLFRMWFTECLGKHISNYSGISIRNLPDFMHIINTDDENNILNSQTYIAFNKLFSFTNNNIPCIHVGNEDLQYYPNHQSIQFWYLDNNGEGAGRLHFVFGVNTEENEKEIYVSVATKRSPYIYSDDHKHIIGSVKQMTPTNYEQNNVMVPYQDIAPTIAIKDNTLTISTTSLVSESYDVYVDNVFAQNITTTTFDLSSLNLNEGTYAIKVKAKTSIGLSDSDFSNVVSFTV